MELLSLFPTTAHSMLKKQYYIIVPNIIVPNIITPYQSFSFINTFHDAVHFKINTFDNPHRQYNTCAVRAQCNAQYSAVQILKSEVHVSR